MDALDRYKARVQRLQGALERLTALHSQVYDLQGEIVALSKSEIPDRNARVDALHQKVAALQPEIEKAKRELAERGA
jgi:peptidoglycan hydrolase CwlO-like protein